MKHIILYIWCLSLALCLASCSDSGRRVADGLPYLISGTLWQDSLRVDSCVTLIIDRHDECLTSDGDTLAAFESVQIPVVDGSFAYQGNAPYDIDELVLIDQHQHVVHIYAGSGSNIDIKVTENDETEFSPNDTINYWMNQRVDEMTQMEASDIKHELDSICSAFGHDIRSALLLREVMPMVNDSIFVRRTLGKLSEDAKPEWLIRDINERFDILSRRIGKSFRLPRAELQIPDTTYSLLASRQESLVLLFWAEDDSVSVDSLNVFRQIARDFGLYDNEKTFATEKSATRSKNARRIELMSVCVHAHDSASWQAATKGIPGKHVWLEGGMAHPLSVSCMVCQLPAIYCFDRFSNYQCHDTWSADLYEYLNKANINSSVANKLKNK